MIEIIPNRVGNYERLLDLPVKDGFVEPDAGQDVMKMVVAYIRHEAFEPIRQDLMNAGFPSLSISEVKGSGRQKGITEHYRGSEIAIHLRPKLKVECVVDDGDASTIVDAILRHARTGSVGDGKIFVLPVEEAIRVNTLNGAYASREEPIKGSIAAGKLADFVMLAEDPHAVRPDRIKDIAIVRTVVGGAATYEA